MRRILLSVPCVWTLVCSPALSHPHQFMEGGLSFVMDGGTQLTHVEVTWVFDQFYSLFVISDEGMDADGDLQLTSAEGKRLATLYSQWMEGFDGDSYVRLDGETLWLSGPQDADMVLAEHGRMVMTFRRALEAPIEVAGQQIEAQTYDPTFYIQYFVTEPVNVIDGASSCSTEHRPLELNGGLVELQQNLLDFDIYSTPAIPDVGRQFADTLVLTCG